MIPTSSASLTKFGSKSAVSIADFKIAKTSCQWSAVQLSIADMGITMPHFCFLAALVLLFVAIAGLKHIYTECLLLCSGVTVQKNKSNPLAPHSSAFDLIAQTVVQQR